MKEKTIYFWKISAKQPYLEASLVKLNVPEIQIRNFINNINIFGEDKIYIAPHASDNTQSRNHVSWNKDDKYGYIGLKELGYIYKGELSLTLQEVEAILSANKYNL